MTYWEFLEIFFSWFGTTDAFLVFGVFGWFATILGAVAAFWFGSEELPYQLEKIRRIWVRRGLTSLYWILFVVGTFFAVTSSFWLMTLGGI